MSEIEAPGGSVFSRVDDAQGAPRARQAARSAPLGRALAGDVVLFADFALIVVLAGLVAALAGLSDPDAWRRHVAAGILGATAFTTLTGRAGGYDFPRLIGPRRVLRSTVARWGLAVCGLAAFAFGLGVTDQFSRIWLGLWSLTAIGGVVTVHRSAGALLRRAAEGDGAFARRVAVVGDMAAAAKFAERAASAAEPISIVGVFQLAPDCAQDAEPSFDLTGDLARLSALARRGELDDIVVASVDACSAKMTTLMKRLSILPVSVSICAPETWLDHCGGRAERIGDAPVLHLHRRPLEGWGGVLKTVEDRVLGVALLVAASPVLAGVALAVRLSSPGPILFRQKRHGFNHEVFDIYKFRTMTVMENGDVVRQATKDDVRVTPVGRFLRRYSLDELPQLLNVVAGEMSLVGPRPHALAHNHQYARTIENYSGRHKVKPGITGWAQVNGCRGETSDPALMAARVRYDLDYIENWSIGFDLKILVLTVRAVLFPDNAY
ncbi:MAG: undecaprenyl-phosphate glucose phosphotransferase [Pseudomonadota bacterium]